jgi:hypothetical protein
VSSPLSLSLPVSSSLFVRSEPAAELSLLGGGTGKPTGTRGGKGGTGGPGGAGTPLNTGMGGAGFVSRECESTNNNRSQPDP